MKDFFERTTGSRGGTGRIPAVFFREAGASASREDRALFRCDACGEPTLPGDGCLVTRGQRGRIFRFCGDCAGERLSMGEHLDRMGMRYYAGPAEEAEGWESLGR